MVNEISKSNCSNEYWNLINSSSSLESDSIKTPSSISMSSVKNTNQNFNTLFLKKPVKIVKPTTSFTNNNSELKSVSANYLDKKYSLAMNVNLNTNSRYAALKINDIKNFISNAYDNIKDSKPKVIKINENIINPIEVNESIFVNSTNKLLLKKCSNSLSSFSLSSHQDNLSNNECSDSGYTKSLTSISSENFEEQANDNKTNDSNKNNNNGSVRLETPSNIVDTPRTEKVNAKMIERLKLAVEFSEERRKLLLSKFSEAQELLQVSN